MVDMRHASEIVSKQREGVLGKQLETAIQINNAAPPPPAGGLLLVPGALTLSEWEASLGKSR